MVTFGQGEVPLVTLAELRCVLMALGEPSVMTSGITVMPVWYADNLDTLHLVKRVLLCIYSLPLFPA